MAAGKRVAFSSMAGDPVVAVPGRDDPHSAPLDHIAPNPENPRDADDLDLEELTASFEAVGQLQPVVVMARGVYCTLKPEREAEVPAAARWVVIGGNRRLEAARALGWKSLDIKVRDDLGEGGDRIDEAVMIENIHRKALTPMREAEFLQRMVVRLGSQDTVAKRIRKTQAFVSQRLALLNLAPELQDAVEGKRLTLERARKLASLPSHEAQLAAVAEAPVHNAVMARRSVEPARAVEPPAAGGGHNGVMKEPDLASLGSAEGIGHNGVMKQRRVLAEPLASIPSFVEPEAAPAPVEEIEPPPVAGPVVVRLLPGAAAEVTAAVLMPVLPRREWFAVIEVMLDQLRVD